MLRFPKLIVFVIAFTTIGITGCKKDFLDVNNDPNRVTDQNVTPELIFTRAAVGVGDLVVGGNAFDQGARLPKQFAPDWIGYMAPNGDFIRDYTETSYDIDFNFGNQYWLDNYDILFDLYLAKNKGLESGDTALAGASMVLSAKVFQELVDTYGDIPYSQAFQPITYSHPAFDKAQDIYVALEKSLDTAIQYLNTTVISQFKTSDVINHGNTTKWIKFANTLKLRLLIRQSEVPGFEPAPEISKILSTGGVLEAGESISVNPGYVNELNKQSPFFANYGYTTTGIRATTGYNANAYIIDILTSTNDPRIERFFTPAGSSFVGNTYGDDPGNLSSGVNSSYFGPALSGSPDQDQWIYPSFESLFLKAEAIARGWMPGDAKAAYEAAVTESFVWLGVPDAVTAATTYMQTNDVADWANAGSTAADKAKFIVFQKYIAMTCIDPLEAWADERRLHFLPPGFVSVNTSRISNTIPLRLLYPQSEYTRNPESVKAEGTINQFTSKIFWQP
jgi:Starch-binding associating with outer membrane